MAVDALGDWRLAAETYEALRDLDPADREAWEPLLDVYRRLDDKPKLAELLAAIVEYVEDPKERSRLRLERVRILDADPGMRDDVAETLREIVDEDPSQIEAAMMLANVLEREGRVDDLAELLGQQLDAAKDRADAASVASLAMRLGRLLEKKDPLEARNVYYAGLEWDASSRELLVALRDLLAVDGDPSDRADVSERLLALTTGSDAERLALDLAAMRADSQDDEGAERALEAGYKAYPASLALRARLDARYRERGAFAKLAELCVVDAATRADPDEKVARLREAAAIYRDELRDPANAARVLEVAIRERPAAAGLLNEVVVALVDAGDLAGAERELTLALERQSTESFARSAILAKRAQVRQLRSDDDGALADLEAAFAVGAAEHAPALAKQLERSVALADAAGDARRARELRLRLADVLSHAGSIDAAHALVDAMAKTDPRDRDALRALARLEKTAGRWDAASAVYRRLVALEEDPRLVVETALELADACERAERLGDARGGLERARMIAPSDAALRARLEDLYARTGAVRERAEIYLADARDTGDVAARFELLVQAGGLLMQEGGDLDAAIVALTEARALRPNEHESVALLADALTLAGKMSEATELLNEAVAGHKGRRSRELGSLHHRLARVAAATGDAQGEVACLTHALDMDSQNGDIAAELATAAILTNQLELANRALRVVTMLKTPGPMPKALAYKYMGDIAQAQGDTKRAVMLLKRAVQEDPSLDEARELLESLQGS
jgi:tetratricopeptide (TPR) repeat protein